MTNVKMMREMQIAGSVQMSAEKKKIDATEKRREKGRLKQREEADRNRKKSKMMDWLVRRKMDDDLIGEMMYGTQDVALNLADVVGSMGQGKLESRELDITTVGLKDSRNGKTGSLGDKGEEENPVDLLDLCI